MDFMQNELVQKLQKEPKVFDMLDLSQVVEVLKNVADQAQVELRFLVRDNAGCFCRVSPAKNAPFYKAEAIFRSKEFSAMKLRGASILNGSIAEGSKNVFIVELYVRFVVGENEKLRLTDCPKLDYITFVQAVYQMRGQGEHHYSDERVFSITPLTVYQNSLAVHDLSSDGKG